jgi:hypothetical protein
MPITIMSINLFITKLIIQLNMKLEPDEYEQS